MAMFGQPKTVDEYIDLAHQAVYEVDELRALIGEDENQYGGVMDIVLRLDEQLRAFYDSMLDGSYQFDPGGADLPFMATADRLGARLPFKNLLGTINYTHKHGLDVD